MRANFIFAAAALVAAPAVASAQDSDVMGNVNPVDYTSAIALGSAAEADARATARTPSRRSGAPAVSRSTARICQQFPALRARKGAGNPDIVQLGRLCRKVGFRY